MGLKKNIFYSGLLTSLNYIFPLIVYPYISRVLGVANIGLVNFIDSIINYFILFSMMGITIMGIREIAISKNNPKKLEETFSSLITLNTISTVITLIGLILVTLIIPQLRQNYSLMMVGAIKLVGNLFLIEWFYKGIEDFKFITFRSISIRTLYVISVFIFVHKSDDVVTYFLLTSLSIVLNAIINVAYSRKFVSFSLRTIHIKKYLSSFFTLGLYMLLTSMYTTFNITYLGFTCGDIQVGYYSTATKLYSIFISLFSAFTAVMMPRMSSLLAESKIDEFKHKFEQSINILTITTIPFIIFVLFFAKDIVYIISGPGYQGAIIPMRIIIPLMFIIGYEQILVIQTLMPLQKDKIIFRNSIIGAIVSIAINISIVNYLGAVGSAINWVICEIIIFLLSQYAVNRIINISFNIRQLLISISKYLPLCLIFYIISLKIHATTITLFIGLTCLIIYFLIINILFTSKDNVFRNFIKKDLLNRHQ